MNNERTKTALILFQNTHSEDDLKPQCVISKTQFILKKDEVGLPEFIASQVLSKKKRNHTPKVYSRVGILLDYINHIKDYRKENCVTTRCAEKHTAPPL